jgi:deazaflavin-dependent oxidoreductase (nitroreductase family)
MSEQEFDLEAFNNGVIEEFRANDGMCGGMMEGQTMILVHNKGAKSGADRVSPLVYQQLDNGWAIFASAAGAPKSPAWYHNLVANPDTTIEVGADTIAVTASVATGDERSTIWEAQKIGAPQFAEYETSAGDREIPVVVLNRR